MYYISTNGNSNAINRKIAQGFNPFHYSKPEVIPYYLKKIMTKKLPEKKHSNAVKKGKRKAYVNISNAIDEAVAKDGTNHQVQLDYKRSLHTKYKCCLICISRFYYLQLG